MKIIKLSTRQMIFDDIVQNLKEVRTKETVGHPVSDHLLLKSTLDLQIEMYRNNIIIQRMVGYSDIEYFEMLDDVIKNVLQQIKNS